MGQSVSTNEIKTPSMEATSRSKFDGVQGVVALDNGRDSEGLLEERGREERSALRA